MPQHKREELKLKKQAYVQDEIIESAVKLFAVRGYRAVTIDEIASNLGYTKSVVYYYFRSKGEILSRIYDKSYDIYFEKIDQVLAAGLEPGEAMRRVVYNHAMNVMERPEWSTVYWREERELDDKQRKQIAGLKQQYDRKVQSIYAAGVEQGVFKPIPAGVAGRAIIGMCNSLQVWFDPKGPFPATELAEHYVSLLMSGMLLDGKTAHQGKVALRATA